MAGVGKFAAGMDVALDERGLGVSFGPGVFAPEAETRSLDAIRRSLLDADAEGPDPVYSIWMDVGREEDRAELERRFLLFGVVRYASGCVGREPVRSQGHVHAVAAHSGWSPPELFEIWEGTAVVYAQEFCGDAPGRCFAVEAARGEHVIVPPGWAHCVINGNPAEPMTFVALCDRQYGFVYEDVRKRRGLAWFPVMEEGRLRWQANPAYEASRLCVGRPRRYSEFGLVEGVPLYTQYASRPEAFQWVSDPARKAECWRGFDPLEGMAESFGEEAR